MPAVSRKPPKGKNHTQSIVFAKKFWSKDASRKWVKDHDGFVDGHDENETQHRWRQYQPDEANFNYVVLVIKKQEGQTSIFFVRGLPKGRAELDQSLRAYQVRFEENCAVYTASEPSIYPARACIHVEAIDARAVSEDENACDIIFSSETPVRRFNETEILLHDADSVDLGRLHKTASILKNHDPDQIVARPVEARIDPNMRQGKTRIVFGTTADAQKAKTEVLKDKTLRGVSVGYKVQVWKHFDDAGTHNGRNYEAGTWLATRWTPIEVSLTPIPADPSAVVTE